MSEEDDDEDEEEGKAAPQPDDKFKINKTGIHGVEPRSVRARASSPSGETAEGENQAFSSLADVIVSRRMDRERIPVRYCSLGTRDATK